MVMCLCTLQFNIPFAISHQNGDGFVDSKEKMDKIVAAINAELK